MENKEYLSEERYQQAKKKIIRISLIILIVGLVLGIGFIVAGVITQNNAKRINEERYNEAYKKSEENVAQANARLEEIETEKQALNTQIEQKQYECNSMDMMSPSWFADNSKCQGEVSSLRSELNELEMEQFQIENADYTELYTPVLPIKYLIFYFIGGGIIGLSCLVAGVFYLIAKKREIRAFAIQQSMPITQEAIGKMAPTIGNAVGTIGKDIAEGITTGIKNGLNKNK